MKSLRSHLLALWRQHPDWTYDQFARELGQTKDTIRGSFSVLRRTGLIPSAPATPAVKKSKEIKRAAKIKVASTPARTVYYGSSTTRHYGYLKLM